MATSKLVKQLLVEERKGGVMLHFQGNQTIRALTNVYPVFHTQTDLGPYSSPIGLDQLL